ncbi:MAG TPA: hypothetical protein VHZ24_02470 [Pirellulales bacterium]|jgi:hypothetical protein|nr:hypothetical protein [Pirellulales bacterium]
MDARVLRGLVTIIAVGALASAGAGHRTANFIVNAPTPAIAQQVGAAAEQFRRDLAIEWLGKPMPTWAQPCPITVEIGQHLGAGGATSFVFDHGEVFGWQMNIQGPLDRVLDSVLPHEVTHTIIASHFREPLPRWADEGACTTVEHDAERQKQQQMLITFLRTGRGISFSQMFAMREYPHDIMPLYAQGHSLATYLIAQGGRRKFLDFVADGLEQEQWTDAIHRHYGFATLGDLQNTWLDWVRNGSPPLPAHGPGEGMLADNRSPRSDLVVRAQSADPPTPPAAQMQQPVQPEPAAAAIGWRSVEVPAAPPAQPAATDVATATPARQVILEWSRPSGDGEAPIAEDASRQSVYAPRRGATMRR